MSTDHLADESWQLDATPTLDLAALKGRLADLGPDLVRQIVQRFLDDAPANVVAVRNAAQAQDLPTLQRQIHRLGGGAQTVGLSGLSHQAQRAEHALRSGHAEEGLREATRLLGRVDSDLAALARFRDDLRH